MTTSDLVTYDQATSELRSVPEAFAGREKSVLSWVWRSDIQRGNHLEAGAEIADIQWEDNTREVIIASAECSGEISAVNRDIFLENLRYRPSQVLLAIS